MSALHRMLLRDLAHLAGQVVTIALVVGAGVCAFVVMQGNYLALETARDDYYARYRFADVFATCERAPEAVADRLAAIPGVALVETRVVHVVTVLPEGPLAGGQAPVAEVVSIPEDAPPRLDALHLKAGRMPLPGRTDEAVLLERFAARRDVVPGDVLSVVIGGRRHDFSIVGLVTSPEFVFPMPPGGNAVSGDDERFAVLWVPRPAIAPALQMEGAFDDVVLKLQPGASDAAVVAEADRILEPYGGRGAVARDRQVSNFIVRQELGQLRGMALVVPVLFLGIAAFLLDVVLSRIVQLQRGQIAVVKAVGYSDARIALHYLELTSAIVVVGAIVGVGAGDLFGRRINDLYVEVFGFPSLVWRLRADLVAESVGISLGAALFGAFRAMAGVLRLAPADAMRPPSPATYRRGFLDRLGVDRVLAPPARMVLREIERRPARAVMSSVGIGLALGILVMGRYYDEIFDWLVDLQFDTAQRDAVTVTFAEPVPVRAARELLAIPGVKRVEPLRMVPVRFRSGSRYRDAAIDAREDGAQMRRIVDQQGRFHEPPETGLLMSSMLARVLELRPGDLVDVEVREGDYRTVSVRVAGLVDDAFGLQAYMRADALAGLLEETPAATGAALLVDEPDEDAVLAVLRERRGVTDASSHRRAVRLLRDQLQSRLGVAVAMITVFSAIIAVGVLYNNARVALSTRARDLASLRVLGFTVNEISAVLVGELGVHLVAAIPLGLALGAVLVRLIVGSVDAETYRFPTALPTGTREYALLVVVGTAAISALLVRRKLARADLVEVLKSRE